MTIRFNWRSAIAAATAAVTFVFAGTVAAQERFTLTLAETWGPNYPILGDTNRALKERVEAMSNGRLTLRIDSSNRHKAPFGIFDMVKAGQYDIGHTASYYYKGKLPNTMFFTTVPFGMTAQEQYGWFYYGDGMALAEKVYGPHNMLSFPGGNTGVQMGGWFREEINSVEDLQGLKMRTPGFAGEVMADVGAAVTNIPPGEMYTALERGTIDALEWVGPALDLPMGFHRIAQYYYGGWQEPSAELQWLINKDSWNKLPADLQEILKIAMRASAYDMYIQTTHMSGEAWQRMRQEHPEIEFRTFPDEVMQALQASTQKLLGEMAERDPLSREIIESQANYLQMVRPWTNIADRAYLNLTYEE